jgi:hypothetical protein
VYRSIDLSAFVDYGSGAIMCNLFFSGHGDTGHYSVLDFSNNMNIQNLPKEINANTNSKRKTHSLTGRRERKKIVKKTRIREYYFINALYRIIHFKFLPIIWVI